MSKALAQAAKLKPEIRLAQAISEFATSLEGPHRTTFKALQTQAAPKPVDVIKVTEEINRDGQRAHTAWKPYATRLVGILEKLQMISSIGDLLIGNSQNTMASGVWASVKISLSVCDTELVLGIRGLAWN